MWAACPRSLCMHSCGSSSTHGRVVVTRAWRTGSAAITHSPPIWQPQLLSHDTNSGGAPSARRRRDCRLQQFCWQPAGRTLQSPAAMELSGVHESVVQRLLALLDVRSKCSLMCSCRALHAALASRCEHWRELVLDSEGEQRACGARELLYMLQRASGRCEVLALARCGAGPRAARPGGSPHPPSLSWPALRLLRAPSSSAKAVWLLPAASSSHAPHPHVAACLTQVGAGPSSRGPAAL